MRALVCDDEASIRLLFRTAFERLGYEVVEAVDGQECLQQATIFAPDMIVLDLLMPELDGLSTLPRLRTLLPKAAVFVVSAHAGQDAFDQGMAWGADGWFDKLAFLDRLPALVERPEVPT
jgi:CheY-like chemotaxis protein